MLFFLGSVSDVNDSRLGTSVLEADQGFGANFSLDENVLSSRYGLMLIFWTDYLTFDVKY